MKRFLTKVSVFFMVTASLVLCMNYAYIKLDRTNSDGTGKFRSVPSSITVCNFGSSHGNYGFNYEDVNDVVCFNFALDSQSLSYDRRLFDYYKENIAKGAVVFLPVSYFSLYGTDETAGDGFSEKNKRYYKILPVGMIKDYDRQTDIYVNYFPSLTAGLNLIRVMIGKSQDTGDAAWSRVATDIDLAMDAKAAYKRHLVVNKLDENGNRIINQEELDSIKYMIRSCREMGATPILITVPYLREYTDEVRKNCPEFLDAFYDLVNDIRRETGVEYYDYAFDERFINNYGWFMNGDHLNKEGARRFVNILMEEVVYSGGIDSLYQNGGMENIEDSE